MALNSHTYIPSPLTSGDTWEWIIPGGDYPRDDGWSATYYLIGKTHEHTITTTADGENHKVSYLSTAIVKGEYEWALIVSKGTARHTIERGRLIVEPNFATATSGDDLRTENEVILEAIVALLKGDAGSAYSNISVDGRYLVKRNMLELEELRRRYETRVRHEREAREKRLGRAAKQHTMIQFNVG